MINIAHNVLPCLFKVKTVLSGRSQMVSMEGKVAKHNSKFDQ